MESAQITLQQEEKTASEVSKFDAYNVHEKLPVVCEDGGLDCLHVETLDKSCTGDETTQTEQNTEEILKELLVEVVDSVADEIKDEIIKESCVHKIEENANKSETSTITLSPTPQTTQNLYVSTWRSSMGEICEQESECGSDITDSGEGSFTESEDELLETGGVLSGSGCAGPVRRCIVVGGKLIQLPPNITVKRLTQAEGSKSVIERRREAHLDCITEEGSFIGSPSKRKHNERMTLKEVNAADFSDTKDYVDYIQSKLANVQIKIVK